MEKEVKESKASYPLLDIYNSIKEGKNPAQISKDLSMSKQKISYYTRKLKDKELIKKTGYGVWETTTKSPNIANVRGHGFMWKVKSKQVKWLNLLSSYKVPFKPVGFSKVPLILFKDRKILLGKNIIIYEPESFWGRNSIEARKYAVERLLEILEGLESKFDINLKPYQFKVSRQHYSLVKNSLAIQCNKLGQKIQVSNDKGMWFVIDNSFNLNEAETIHPEDALIDSIGVQKYFNSHKSTQFKVTPEFILETMNGIQQNQLEFAKNMVSHIEAIQSLSKGVKKLTKTIGGIINENNKLKMKGQKTLGEF